MATLATTRATFDRDTRFFRITAVIMAVILVAGFSVQFAAGRSSFGAPIRVHIHALVFFGWLALYLLQSFLAGHSTAVALHRKLGWLAVGWIPAMLVMGCYVTVELVRAAHVPFFFTPLYFLVMDPLTLMTFAGLAAAAIVMRRRTQWHRRLMFSAMTILLGPGVGRLIPMPFLIPFAGWAVFAVVILFPLAGIVRDLRVQGRVHPAWWWGLGTIVAMQVGIDLIVMSPAGTALYETVAAGSPGAAIAPRAYPPFPPL